MRRCVIIAAYNPFGIKNSIDLREDDFILCADGGYDIADAEGIEPDVVIGDFDSLRVDLVHASRVIRVPSEKDDTDTMLCLKHGLELGFRDFVIVGGIGGRLDHTLANIQTLSYACESVGKIEMIDQKTRIAMITQGEIRFVRESGMRYISLFAMSDECRGVTITGAKYPLTDATLTSSFPLGISNEFFNDEVAIRVQSGRLLVVIERELDWQQ